MSSKLIDLFLSQKLSVQERIAIGKSIRKKIPVIILGNYKTFPDRKDPVSILEEQGKTRLQDLVPIRYARMLTSSFAFLRGAAAIMAADLAANGFNSGINVQACGDMHVANFGIFASAERSLVFGINDFDETLPAPWEWDLKRLVASIVASGRFIGADKKACTNSVLAAVKSYRKRMKEYTHMGALELWYTTISKKDIRKTFTLAQQKELKKIATKARSRTHMQVLDKLTDIIDKQHRLRDDAPFIVHETHSQSGKPIEESLGLLLESYFLSLSDDRKALLKHYRIIDVARKIVGVGSVGTRCWVLFLKGKHNEDPLFLQVKEAQPSVLEKYISKSDYTSPGQRVVQGQRLLQSASDIFLGWGELDGKYFYVRQLRDMKGSVEIKPGKSKLENFAPYSSLCAWALALAHAKSGDAAVISGYIGNNNELEKAMVKFAFAYADQTEKDHNALAEAAKSGRIEVAN